MRVFKVEFTRDEIIFFIKGATGHKYLDHGVKDRRSGKKKGALIAPSRFWILDFGFWIRLLSEAEVLDFGLY
jgi:hypothetical protein